MSFPLHPFQFKATRFALVARMTSINAASEAPKSKTSVEHIDIIDAINKPDEERELDKFGAATHLAPAEVRLVRKLDMYMMVDLACAQCNEPLLANRP